MTNDSDNRKLDTFQFKGLRKMLRFDTIYVDRGNTNARVYARVYATASRTLHESASTKWRNKMMIFRNQLPQK